MPTISLSPKLDLHYLDLQPEESRTIVLLHGLGVNGDSWQLQFDPLLSAGFRVIAPDTRGFGKSSYPGGSVNIARMADDISRLIQLTGAAPAYFVGISMGGVLALQLALDHPELVDKLVLVNTFARLRPDRPGHWLYYAWRFLLINTLGLPVQARAVAYHIFPHPDQAQLRQIMIEQILQADPRGYRAAMRALALFDVRSRLHEIQKPCLIITGESDTTIPLKSQQELARGITSARQVIIPGAGHAVTIDAPDLFNHVLIEFLELA